jgi:microsomal dipeptidase-like Zn-dependent dipeptidase
MQQSHSHVKGVAATGGVVGIGFWHTAVCGRDARAVAQAIRYAVDLVGPDHVGLGSDFDGSIEAPFDASGMALVTEALLDEGFSEAQIRKIMGENVVRVLAVVLPD